MEKINKLLKELEPIIADPKNCDALKVLSIFSALRWEVMELESSIMAIKFDKETN
jgi:hypothetical protein